MLIPPLCAAVYFTQYLYDHTITNYSASNRYNAHRDKTALNYARRVCFRLRFDSIVDLMQKCDGFPDNWTGLLPILVGP
jgi:hypothetical protein